MVRTEGTALPPFSGGIGNPVDNRYKAIAKAAYSGNQATSKTIRKARPQPFRRCPSRTRYRERWISGRSGRRSLRHVYVLRESKSLEKRINHRPSSFTPS